MKKTVKKSNKEVKCEREKVNVEKNAKKFEKCTSSYCNFIALNHQSMKLHLKICKGVPQFDSNFCKVCQNYLANEKEFKYHLKICKKIINFNSQESFTENNCKNKKITTQNGSNELKSENIVRARSLKHNVDNITEEPEMKKLKETSEIFEQKPPPKKRGRKPKNKVVEEPEGGNSKISVCSESKVKCGKCGFETTRKLFKSHNAKKHVGLGWIEGESPVNLNDEKEIIKLVKEAFKITKTGTCETCQDVKKSFMGFVYHILSCGRSEEEKNALKVQCPYCSSKCLKYSMPMHIKLSHPVKPENSNALEEKSEEKNESVLPKKRRSAIKAVSKFQEVLKDASDSETIEAHYVLYEKSSQKFPKVCAKLNNYWYKFKRENKKIPCQHSNCEILSDDVKAAKTHYFNCPSFPDKVYLCEVCFYYSINESDVKDHIKTHQYEVFESKRKKGSTSKESKNVENSEIDDEEEFVDEEEEGDSTDNEDEDEDVDEKRNQNRKKKKSEFGGNTIHSYESNRKSEKNKSIKLPSVFNIGGVMSLENDISTSEGSNSWLNLHTKLSDWQFLEPSHDLNILPDLKESISIRVDDIDEDVKNVKKWKRLKRFEGDLIGGVPTIFTGGRVRCLSWCKIAFSKLVQKSMKQYLALITTKDLNYLRNIHKKSLSSKTSLIQIWDCGFLENETPIEAPKFSFGIVQDSEIWDLSWFPEDASSEGFGDKLPRLGLLATASDDAVVRIWSVGDPVQLTRKEGPSLYKTSPVAKLTTDENLEDSCLKLSVGKNGIIAGGYANGVIAVWNLHNLSSPFCEKVDRCPIIRSHITIQAHRATITALAFCPQNSRYIASAASDRINKLWDLEMPICPLEQFNKEMCVSIAWPTDWPIIIYNFDDILPTRYKCVAKFVKDIFHDRHQSCMLLENSCLSITFSDWLIALCGSSDNGEIIVRFFKNFICDRNKKDYQNVISSLELERLNDSKNETKLSNSSSEKNVKKNNVPLHYEEIFSQYGLKFKNNSIKNVKVPKRSEFDPDQFPIRAINVVRFNPNFKSFTHLAAGYNCGLVRILNLNNTASGKYAKSILQYCKKKTVSLCNEFNKEKNEN